MDITARTSQQDEILEETATRLIDALGLEAAIFVCRSNYWHGVLRLVLARRNDGSVQSHQHDNLHALCPSRLHSLPQTVIRHDQPDDDAPSLPIAA